MKERSDLSLRSFFKKIQGLIPEPEFSQRHISIGISCRDNALKPPKLQASFKAKMEEKAKPSPDEKNSWNYEKN